MPGQDDKPAASAACLKLPVAALLLGSAACAAGAWLGAPFAPPGANWLLRAAASPLSLACAAVLLAGGAALMVLGRAMLLAGRRLRPAGQDGTILLEFALILPFAMMIVLVMLQSALLMAGNLCVHYGAYCAARSAIVHIPVDYGAEGPNIIASPRWSAKTHRAREAAAWAVMPVARGHRSQTADSVGDVQGDVERLFAFHGQATPRWMDDRIGRKLRYARDFTEVEFGVLDAEGRFGPHGSLGGDSGIYEFEPRQDVTVQVEHTLYLSVPYASWLFATVDRRNGRRLDFGASEYGMLIRATSTLSNEGVQDWIDVERFGG